MSSTPRPLSPQHHSLPVCRLRGETQPQGQGFRNSLVILALKKHFNAVTFTGAVNSPPEPSTCHPLARAHPHPSERQVWKRVCWDNSPSQQRPPDQGNASFISRKAGRRVPLGCGQAPAARGIPAPRAKKRSQRQRSGRDQAPPNVTAAFFSFPKLFLLSFSGSAVNVPVNLRVTRQRWRKTH